jgi:acyl-coenzyme A thioesterase PaaI-like protein
MVWGCAVQTRRFGYCAELVVRFVNPLRPGEEVLATGELVANRRNKIFESKGELRTNSGLVVATATGKYLPVKESETPKMMEDFVGDIRELFGGP